MKLKKKPKRILITLLILLIIGGVGFGVYKFTFSKEKVKETKVVGKIDKYGYTLKDNKSAKYKEMFKELKDILKEDPVNEKKYVKKISEMFIYDFYSLSNKTAKTDVGGTDFVYQEVLDNFLENAEDTYYKYLESDIYGERKQSLPTVSKVTIEEVSQDSFTYNDKTDEEAYLVKASWTYKEDGFSDYQKEANLVFIHNDPRLDLVELK